jgi:hypothetical protein
VYLTASGDRGEPSRAAPIKPVSSSPYEAPELGIWLSTKKFDGLPTLLMVGQR